MIRQGNRIGIADGSHCGKKLHESQSQEDTEIRGAGAQSVPALWTLTRIFAALPALPPLFSLSGSGGRNTGSHQIELVNIIDDLRLTI
jgi:hypothetical protein